MCPPRTDSKEISFPGRKIRCVLVHDHVLLRQGLRRLLQDEPDIDVVGEAGNDAECLRKLDELRPDVLVADAGRFGVSAAEAERLVARESSHTKVVFLSAAEEAEAWPGSSRMPAGCAVRETSATELAEMVRSLSGKFSRPTAISREEEKSEEAAELRDPPRPAPTLFPRERTLTVREREVLKLLAEGKTVRAAAMVLGVSRKTVDAHKFNLMRKLGIHNKAELVMWAIQKRVVKIPANF